MSAFIFRKINSFSGTILSVVDNARFDCNAHRDAPRQSSLSDTAGENHSNTIE